MLAFRFERWYKTNKMDYNEFEIIESNVNTEAKRSDEIEFLITELNSIAHAAGRYSRSVQIPRAYYILNKLKEMGTLANER